MTPAADSPAIAGALGAITSGISDRLGAQGAAAQSALDDVIGGVLGTIAGWLGNLWSLLREFGILIEQRLADIREQIVQRVAVIVQALGTWLGQIGGELGRVLNVIEDFPRDIALRLAGALPDALGGAVLWALEHREDLLDALKLFLPNVHTPGLFRAVDRMLRDGARLTDFQKVETPPELENPIEKFFWSILAGFGFVWSMKDIPAEQPGERLRQDFNTHFQFNIPPITAVVEADRRQLADPASVDALRMGNGFGPSAYRMLKDVSTGELSPLQVLDLWNRNGRKAEFLSTHLSRSGVPERDFPLYQQLADGLATPSDLIRFLIREVFSPGQRAALTLDADYPEGADAEFAKVGVSPALARNYWAAHWELPSPQMGFEMFHRGIITGDELAALLKALDYAPTWRDKLTRLNYVRITRVDIRRVAKALGKDHAWIVERYKALGYTPDDAETLATFTEKLNADDAAAQIKAIRAPIERQIVARLEDGAITGAQAGALLDRLSYTPAQRGEINALALSQRAADKQGDIRAAIRSGYISGVRSEVDALAQLAETGHNAAQAKELIGVWQYARANRELTETQKEARDLTKAEILASYESAVLTRADARRMLQALHYDAAESATLLALSDAKQLKVARAAEQAAIKARFVAGKIDRNAAMAALDASGISTRQRNGLLATWELERASKEAHISVADLQAMQKAGIVTFTEAAGELRAAGYGEKEARWLLQLWGASKAEADSALKPAAP